jgi:hypothetical protein
VRRLQLGVEMVDLVQEFTSELVPDDRTHTVRPDDQALGCYGAEGQ